MKEVSAGVREIRIHVLGEWRVLYVAKFAESVYVLHVFQKKTQKTTREDIEWLVHATGRSETGDEEENDQIQRQCLCGSWL